VWPGRIGSVPLAKPVSQRGPVSCLCFSLDHAKTCHIAVLYVFRIAAASMLPDNRVHFCEFFTVESLRRKVEGSRLHIIPNDDCKPFLFSGCTFSTKSGYR
jgi:hypothetical protein